MVRVARVVATTVAVAAVVGGVGLPSASAAPVPVPGRVAAPVLGPGSEIDVVQERGADGRLLASSCTVGFIAERPDGRRVALTAGHCGKRGQAVGAPVAGRPDALVRVGTVAQSSNPPARKTRDGYVLPEDLSAPDWAVIDLAPKTRSTASRGPVRPTRVGDARVGDRVCQQGVTTGWRCGVVRAVSPTQIRTDIDGAEGDSGGPLIRPSDGAALGLITGGTAKEAPRDVPRMSFYWSLRDALARGGGLRLVTVGAPALQAVSSPDVGDVITVDGSVPVGAF